MNTQAQKRAQLPVSIANAARLVPPLWPIETFIAVNPLLGLIDLGFDEAAVEADRWLGARCHPRNELLERALRDGDVADCDVPDGSVSDLLGRPEPPASRTAPRTLVERLDADRGTRVAEAVDAEVARWCATLIDPHGPGASAGSFFDAWRELAPHDRRLRRLVTTEGRELLEAIPAEADLAALQALEILGVGVDPTDEIRGQLARLPGWASYAKWCDDWAAPDHPVPRLRLVDLLAVRLTTDAMTLTGEEAARASFQTERTSVPAGREQAVREAHQQGRAVLETLENGFRRRFLDLLDSSTDPNSSTDPASDRASGGTGAGGVAAQVVCCIDVRSEGLRRHIEAAGPYETLGFAGFFATPIRFRPFGAEEAYPSAPVLLTPEVEVDELPGDDAAGRSLEARRQRTALADTYDDVAHGPLAMFQLAEMAGWVTGPAALARTVAPWMARSPEASGITELVLDGPHGFDLDSRAAVAETALTTMGLTSGFAPLVVMCGHGSTSAANPHASSLDCGACGGNRGGPNARAAADICNDPDVRERLARRGIDIPASTWFMAAEHDTTTDTVTLLDLESVPGSHRADVETLSEALDAAGAANLAERLAKLPGGSGGRKAAKRAASRARDWAETRPEWGLARNAAFVVGPRSATAGLDLGGRAFLHSYDDVADTEGTALETILTAPMVVAHWINAQYFFSTVDPRHFGAGDKTLHNPVAGIGVLEGAGGDLRGGLAWQSVGFGDEEYHEPLRLLTVVQAPLERIDAVVARNSILQQLFDGSWVHLVAREHGSGPWYRRMPGGRWQQESGNITGHGRPSAGQEEAAA